MTPAPGLCAASAILVAHIEPAPVVEYIEPPPVVGYVAPALAVSHVASCDHRASACDQGLVSVPVFGYVVRVTRGTSSTCVRRANARGRLHSAGAYRVKLQLCTSRQRR